MPWIPRSMWRWRPGAMCSVSRYRTESQRSNRATAVLSENERHLPDSGDIGIQRNEIARKGKRQVAAFEQRVSGCSSECDSVVINTAQYTIRSPAVAGSGAASGGGKHKRPPRPGVGSPPDKSPGHPASRRHSRASARAPEYSASCAPSSADAAPADKPSGSPPLVRHSHR